MQRRLPTTHPTIIQIIPKLSSSSLVVDGVDVVIVLEVEVVLLLLVVVAAAGEVDVVGDDIIVGDVADIDVAGNTRISAGFI